MPVELTASESLTAVVLFITGHALSVVINKMRLARLSKQLSTKTAIRSTHFRVASVLPSATEILCAIGGDSLLVGRSHEDNFPTTITHLPMLTDQLISKTWTNAAAVNAEVSCALSSGKSLYFLNAELLAELKPDLILTQVRTRAFNRFMISIEQCYVSNRAKISHGVSQVCILLNAEFLAELVPDSG
jgi:ABC-type hemin transport system substrate-binding protein